MKKNLLSVILLMSSLTFMNAQISDTDVKSQLATGKIITATTTAATRLFSDYEDLSSVQLIVPTNSTVELIDIVDVYYKVKYNEDEGYILKRQASIDKVTNLSAVISDERYDALMEKYDSDKAKAIYEHKIWKGMNGDMVADSWGDPKKKDKMIIGNIVNETWQYTTTWLYFENDILSDWGEL